jgi:hypothetical protein
MQTNSNSDAGPAHPTVSTRSVSEVSTLLNHVGKMIDEFWVKISPDICNQLRHGKRTYVNIETVDFGAEIQGILEQSLNNFPFELPEEEYKFIMEHSLLRAARIQYCLLEPIYLVNYIPGVSSIETHKDSDNPYSNLSERLRVLSEFAEHNALPDVVLLANRILPELGLSVAEMEKVPDQAPEPWLGAGKTIDAEGNVETPASFIRRVYEPWLGKGLTRAHIRQRDPDLSIALDNWLRKNAMPADLDLPTAAEWNTRRLEELRADPDRPTTMTLAEARTLVDADRKRSQRSKGKDT